MCGTGTWGCFTAPAVRTKQWLVARAPGPCMPLQAHTSLGVRRSRCTAAQLESAAAGAGLQQPASRRCLCQPEAAHDGGPLDAPCDTHSHEAVTCKLLTPMLASRAAPCVLSTAQHSSPCSPHSPRCSSRVLPCCSPHAGMAPLASQTL